MQSTPQPSQRPTVREAHRQLRLAIDECKTLLKRTEEMLHQSQQDNQPRH